VSGRAAAAAVLLFALACRSRTAEPPIRNAAPTGRNVIAFGDSLTEGYRMPSGQSYPSHLSRMLRVPILNKGVSGDTTADALARLERDVLSQNPRVVLVCLGANDMLRRLPPESQFANLETVIREIQARGALVVLIGIEGYEGALPRVDYGGRYRALAETTGAVYVPDLLAGIRRQPGLMHDEIHPSAAGYEKIATRLAEEAGEYIRR
jgi:lysophospholipase L1-like esterase